MAQVPSATGGRVGTPTYPGGVNTFVRSHSATGNLIVSYSRNPSDFPLARYCQYREVDKEAGYYLRINIEQAGRLVGGEIHEYVWPDGADRPRRNSGTEKFNFVEYRTTRTDYDFHLGYKTANQADWDIRDTEAAFNAQQAMTGRTLLAVKLLEDESHWDTPHVADVATDIDGNTGTWDASTTQRMDIKRSLNWGRDQIRRSTLSVVRKRDLILVMNPVAAARIGESQEIVDYIKGSPDSWAQVVNQEGKWSEYGMPNYLYGYEVVVEDTVYTDSRRGLPTDAAVKKDVMMDTVAFLLARPGGLVSKAASGPSFSTLMMFLLEELTVETRDDADNRRVEGHVVDDVAPALTSPASGFYFKNVIAVAP